MKRLGLSLAMAAVLVAATYQDCPAVSTAPPGYPSVAALRWQARAQSYPYSASVFPYLFLFSRNGQPPVVNYYYFVRPQLEQQAINAAQEVELQRLERRLQSQSFPEMRLPLRRAPASFMNRSHYFGR